MKFRIWVFFGWNLKKTIAIFETYATLHAKIKKLTFRTKITLSGYSRARIS